MRDTKPSDEWLAGVGAWIGLAGAAFAPRPFEAVPPAGDFEFSSGTLLSLGAGLLRPPRPTILLAKGP